MRCYLPMVLVAMLNVSNQSWIEPRGRLPSLPEARVENVTIEEQELVFYDPIEEASSSFLTFLVFFILP